MEKVFEIYIKTTPERLWEAITDPADPGQVQLRRRRRLRLDAGLAHRDARAEKADGLLGEGEVLEADPPAPAGAHADRPLQPRGARPRAPRG